ncbi:MAG TPA: biliverdin-producing heme oxygenase [Rhizomicrobium sp.]
MLETTAPLTTASPSVRGRLKIATTAAHARLDTLAERFDLSTRTAYAEFLSAHAAVLIPLEQMLAENGVVDLLADWPERSRSSALMRDLDILRADLRAALVPSFATEAEMFGVLYVLEGSRLGARVILRAIDENTMNGATHYLRHGGVKLWPSFLDAMENAPGVAANFPATLDAALTTFEIFERAFGAELQAAA